MTRIDLKSLQDQPKHAALKDRLHQAVTDVLKAVTNAIRAYFQHTDSCGDTIAKDEAADLEGLPHIHDGIRSGALA